MSSSIVLSFVTFIYGLATVLYFISSIFKKPLPGRMATWVIALGFIGNLVGIILRWVESYAIGYGHAPFSNQYESLILFSLTIAGLFLYIEWKFKNKIIGAFASPIAFLAMAYASLSPNINDRIQPLIPALKSNWLIAHVITCFLGYAGFAVAFGVSTMYLLKIMDKNQKVGFIARFPESGILDELTPPIGYVRIFILTIGIITGSVWANSAWGRYWGWDPKETWSLITWFIYALFLHARLMRGWQGTRIAIISVAGFAAVLFTYFGVNYLPGLHSYG